ncbi:MAG TPA: HAMP domain-containing sensor histidine kinase [Candidatus Binatia bacterium]
MAPAMSETIDTGALSQPAKADGKTAMRQPPAMTVSTAALRIGLAHFIHEINNPLQSVYWTAGMMDKLMPKANGCGDPFVGKMFHELKGGVDRLVSLVGALESQLKSLWMIDPCFAAVNVDSLIDGLLQSEATSFADAGIRIVKDIGANLPAVRGDEKLLRQIFLNLIRNAVDAMPKGGVLSVRTDRREASLWLELSDTGVGIPPGVDVFRPFATSKPKGMGLGLAITRHIVETHGGTISYESQPGKGTTFYLSLPRIIETNPRPCLGEAAGENNSDGLGLALHNNLEDIRYGT